MSISDTTSVVTIRERKVYYNPKEFEVLGNVVKFLHYIGDGKRVKNPKGNTFCFSMFCDYAGESLDLSEFDTSEIVHMGCMFMNCSNLTSLDLSNFDTSKVVSMNDMFYGCESLEVLNLSSFNTKNVHTMDCIFCNCKRLSQLNIDNFNFNSVVAHNAADYIFYGYNESIIPEWYRKITKELIECKV